MSIDRDRLKALFKSTNQTYLGAHFSIAGGIHRALIAAQAYGCTAAQLFTKNAKTWKERRLIDTDIHLFKQAVKDTRITRIASHTSYLINLATPERKKQAKSKRALTGELIRSDALGIPFIVHHPGSHMGSGLEKGLDRIVSAVNDIFNDNPGLTPRLLFETTAGQGTGIGHRFEQLADIITRIEAKNRVGVCLDTCHIFAAGYDIRTKKTYWETMERFDDIIGLSNLYFIHLNDSLKAFCSRVDRHAHIGQGAIGMDGFQFVMTDPRLSGIPKIIETPKGSGNEDSDTVNLARLLNFIR
ncbi:MAG: deoxyribonuclease IV [Thermodesulfobacteriota bacterium]|nr:deoxyribonuclease IV [Thermodesulfobacteriota bacterium]